MLAIDSWSRLATIDCEGKWPVEPVLPQKPGAQANAAALRIYHLARRAGCAQKQQTVRWR